MKKTKMPIIDQNDIVSDQQVKQYMTSWVSANRPSKRIWTDFNPFLYQCGNTYASSFFSASSRSTDYNIYLGGVCDLRHLLETCFKASSSSDSSERTVCLNFHLNDINMTNLARIFVMLCAVMQLNDDDESGGEAIGRTRRIADLLMLWSSPFVYKSQREWIDRLLDYAERALQKQQLPSWFASGNSKEMCSSLRSAIQLWRKFNFSKGSLFFHGHGNKMPIDLAPNIQRILCNYMRISQEEAERLCKPTDDKDDDDDTTNTGPLNYGKLKYSTSIRENW